MGQRGKKELFTHSVGELREGWLGKKPLKGLGGREIWLLFVRKGDNIKEKKPHIISGIHCGSRRMEGLISSTLEQKAGKGGVDALLKLLLGHPHPMVFSSSFVFLSFSSF